MTSASTYRIVSGFTVMPLLFLLLVSGAVQAREYDPYSNAELAQMLAPIALYPDALLAQVLMASTYPIEVVEAERWVRVNTGLKNEALDAALLRKDWDPSVKALTHFPSVLTLLSERISETTELGNAFLAQEEAVMITVQKLRAQAYSQGNLATTSRQQVIVDKETIIIQPTNPRVIYVPYYDPYFVYGSWWYPAYPPAYWGPPGVRISYGIGYWPGFSFSFSYGTWTRLDWHRRVIHIDAQKRPRFVRQEQWIITAGTWKHAPTHRRGVAYRDQSTARKYSQRSYHTTATRRDGYNSSSPRQRETNQRIIVNQQTTIKQIQPSNHRHRTEQNRQLTQRTRSERVETRQTEHNRQQQRLSDTQKQQQRTVTTRRQTTDAERTRLAQRVNPAQREQPSETSDRRQNQARDETQKALPSRQHVQRNTAEPEVVERRSAQSSERWQGNRQARSEPSRNHNRPDQRGQDNRDGHMRQR